MHAQRTGARRPVIVQSPRNLLDSLHIDSFSSLSLSLSSFHLFLLIFCPPVFGDQSPRNLRSYWCALSSVKSSCSCCCSARPEGGEEWVWSAGEGLGRTACFFSHPLFLSPCHPFPLCSLTSFTLLLSVGTFFFISWQECTYGKISFFPPLVSIPVQVGTTLAFLSYCLTGQACHWCFQTYVCAAMQPKRRVETKHQVQREASSGFMWQKQDSRTLRRKKRIFFWDKSTSRSLVDLCALFRATCVFAHQCVSESDGRTTASDGSSQPRRSAPPLCFFLSTHKLVKLTHIQGIQNWFESTERLLVLNLFEWLACVCVCGTRALVQS